MVRYGAEAAASGRRAEGNVSIDGPCAHQAQFLARDVSFFVIVLSMYVNADDGGVGAKSIALFRRHVLFVYRV